MVSFYGDSLLGPLLKVSFYGGVFDTSKSTLIIECFIEVNT
jgi:hypothetical protein